jgi:hypothetical protein
VPPPHNMVLLWRAKILHKQARKRREDTKNHFEKSAKIFGTSYSFASAASPISFFIRDLRVHRCSIPGGPSPSMKLTALVHALALGASSAFVGLVSQRSLAPTHAVTHAVRPRPLHRQRDTIKAGIPGSGYVRNMRKQMDAMVAGRGKKAKGSGGAAAAQAPPMELYGPPGLSAPAPVAPVAPVPVAAPVQTAAVAPVAVAPVAVAPTPTPATAPLSPDCRRMYVHWCYIMTLATSMVNSATLIQFDEVVMHMTGPSTKGPLFLASGLAARGWHNMGTIGAFLFGCFFAGLATCQKDANTPVKETAPWLLMGGSVLAFAGSMATLNEHSCLYLAAAAGGLLNGLTTKMTTFRVSHVTGTVTDLGLLIGKWLGGTLDATSALKLRDLGVLLSAWLFGGAASFWLSNFMDVGNVMQIAAIPVVALGMKGLLKPYAKGPFKL